MAEAGWPLRTETFYYPHRNGAPGCYPSTSRQGGRALPRGSRADREGSPALPPPDEDRVKIAVIVSDKTGTLTKNAGSLPCREGGRQQAFRPIPPGVHFGHRITATTPSFGRKEWASLASFLGRQENRRSSLTRWRAVSTTSHT